MNVAELKMVLEMHPDRKIRFILPDSTTIPVHFHITEVGHVRKDFIDCGGTRRAASACVLQAWVAARDDDHFLEAGKLAKILRLAGEILPSEEISVEVEFEAPYISQFPIESAEAVDDAVVFHLAAKQTDCLAKERCGLEGVSSERGCCG